MVKLTLKKKADAPHGRDPIPITVGIAEAAAEYKAIDIRAYDLRGLTVIADTFVLCSADSEPQMRAIMNGVRARMRELGIRPLHAEGEITGGWLLLDYGDVVCHVFRREARAFFDLDGLWGDAPRIALDLD